MYSEYRTKCPVLDLLQSSFVLSEHEEFFKNFLARYNLFFFVLFSLSLEVLTSSCFSNDEVSVTLSFELSVRVIERIT